MHVKFLCPFSCLMLLSSILAIVQAGSYLAEASYDTKNTVEDELAKDMVREVVMNNRLKAACPLPFDEGQMWRGHEGASLYQQLQKDFRNLT